MVLRIFEVGQSKSAAWGKNASALTAPVEVREFLAEAHAGTVQFDLQRATTVARQLGVEPKPFSIAIAQFVADQNRRTIEQSFAAAGEKQ